jgi:alpha-amylase
MSHVNCVMIPVLGSLFLTLFACSALAATAEQWRGRSIYQYVLTDIQVFWMQYLANMQLCRLITDRFALSAGASTTQCDSAARTWCGGTWNSLVSAHIYGKLLI